MNLTFPDNLQLVPGFYPLASLLTGAALYALYRLFIRMRCRSRQAQTFLTLGMCLMTAALFLRLTVWVEAAPGTLPQPAADIRPATERAAPFPQASSVTSQTRALPAATPDNHPRPSEKIQEALATAWDYVLSNLLPAYGAGIALLLLYMAAQMGQLHRIRRKSTLQGYRGCIRVYQSPCNTPFSYSYNIFLPHDMKDGQRDFVLAHEENHIWHRHFHKLLFLQCLTIANWFNPFAYLLFRALKELQEMEVDHDVLNNGFDRQQYQINLVLTCTAHKEWIWAQSNYNYSSLKERILFMNKNIQNSRSRLLVLAAAICLAGLTGSIATQAMEKTGDTPEKRPATSAQTDTPRTSAVDGKEHTRQPATTSAKRATATVASSPKTAMASSQSEQKYDSRGCWTMLFIGDSAYQHHQAAPFVPHYKFFGKKASLTLTINWKNADGTTVIGGATGDYDPFSETTVREGGQVRPRQWVDANHIDDTWKDTYRISPYNSSLWKTERWERCAVPEEVKRTVAAYKQCRKRKDKLKGVWKQLTPGRSSEIYTFFGKDRFFSVDLKPYEQINLFYTFSGRAGDFAYVNDTTVIKGQTVYKLEWLNKDIFSYEDQAGQTLTYVRVEMPEIIRQVIEGCGLD